MAGPSTVLRLVVPQPAFVGDDRRPTWRALRPTPDDLEEAKTKGMPVRVSVWDLELATLEEVEHFLRPTKPRAPFELAAADVAAAREHWSRPAVQLVADPRPEDAPAAKAHCGIEGLEQDKGESEKKWGARLSFLSGRMQPHTG